MYEIGGAPALLSRPMGKDARVKLEPEAGRDSALSERIGRLATVSAGGDPHVVPVTFAEVESRLAIGIDEKPKTTFQLKRLSNIRANPRVALLWDRYDEDWTQLWWVRADGVASIEEQGTLWGRAWQALNEKYGQYEGRAHNGPVIMIEVTKWSGWAHG